MSPNDPNNRPRGHTRAIQIPREQPRKRRAHRVSRACDFCHSRSIRCRPCETGDGPCQSCVEYQRDCTYYRPIKKRGVKSSAHPGSLSSVSPSTDGRTEPDSPFHTAAFVSEPTLLRLVDVFFETIYPLFPLFHRQTLLRRVEAREHLLDQAFFASIASLCALTVARIRDGAPYSVNWSSKEIGALPDSQSLSKIAQDAIPKDVKACKSLDYSRACALSALAGMQNGDIRDFQLWLGLYHLWSRVDGSTHEKNWPPGISIVEREERRRLFWSMYTLDVFSAACFDSPFFTSESQSCVRYPELDDDLLEQQAQREMDATPSEVPDYGLATTSWLQGWNFVTDLYRVLEHALHRRRDKENEHFAVGIDRPFEVNSNSPAHIVSEIMKRYDSLPNQFKEIHHLTFDRARDRYGFQAANIAATIQLLRIVLFTPDVATDEERCSIVREVIQTFAEVPVGYLKAMSTPLLHHLGGIGAFTESALERPLSDSTFNLVRSTLLRLTDLLASLGTGILVAEGPSKRIAKQIERMEAHMQVQLRLASDAGTRFDPDPIVAYSSPHDATPTRSAFAKSHTQYATQPLQSPVMTANFASLTLPAEVKVVDFAGAPGTNGPAQQECLQDGTRGQFSFHGGMHEDWSWAVDFGHDHGVEKMAHSGV